MFRVDRNESSKTKCNFLPTEKETVMLQNVRSITLAGFMQPNRVEKLRNARWIPCDEDDDKAKCFPLITVRLYDLNRPSDQRFNTVHYKITVKDKTSGEKFSIIGYSFPGVIELVTEPSPEVTICGSTFDTRPKKSKVLYEVTFAILPV